MIKRTLATKLREAASRYPVVTVTGPRQSGKTTLIRAEFQDYSYVSLELPDQRAFALDDPRGFLAQFDGPIILDEAQRAPDLFSYIQTMVDEEDRPGRFILTGSQNFLLLQGISQSLAGRCAVLHLLPFSLAELANRSPIPLTAMGEEIFRSVSAPEMGLLDYLFSGFYPRIHDKGLPPHEWLANYYQTYLERDVRTITNVGDIETFARFVRLCAGRCGQIMNLSSLASDTGITHTTARRWISILEASFLIVLLRPHHQNFGKRLIKSPKLYFLDPGLLCFLLKVREPGDLHQHGSRGAIFETFVFSELYKNFIHRGEQPEIYFWRDSAGHEVDFLIDLGNRLLAVEAKSALTVARDFFDELGYWQQLSGATGGPAALVYGGDQTYRRGGVAVYPWHVL